MKSLLNKKQADSGHFAAAATKAIKNTFQSKDPYVSAIGQVHPSHKKWYKLTLDIEFEALQTPTTLTTGIFPSCPTLLASLVRGEECKDNFSVDSPLEDVASKEWEDRPWGGETVWYASELVTLISSAKYSTRNLEPPNGYGFSFFYRITRFVAMVLQSS